MLEATYNCDHLIEVNTKLERSQFVTFALEPTSALQPSPCCLKTSGGQLVTDHGRRTSQHKPHMHTVGQTGIGRTSKRKKAGNVQQQHISGKTVK